MADANCTRACAHCGTGFHPSPNERRPKMYCSTPCRWGAKAAAKKARPTVPCSVAECGKPASYKGLCHGHGYRLRTYGDPLGTGRPRVEKACSECGQVMSLTRGQAGKRVCCSIKCVSDRAIRLAGHTHRTAQMVACCGCGITSARKVKKDDAGRYCSRQCNTDSMVRVAAEKSSLARIARAWLPPVPEWVEVVAAEVAALRRIARYVERPRVSQRPCACCGEPLRWIRKKGGSQRVCDSCRAEKTRASAIAFRASETGRKAKRIAKSRRRARLRMLPAERIDPIEVFERDGWRCYLCGCDTPKHLRGTLEPNAPELEHKLALANGGTHTWGNVACACRACNGKKGVEQLAA